MHPGVNHTPLEEKVNIYTKGGEIPFKHFFFPDGQPHLELLLEEKDFLAATIETRITCANELILLLLAKDALDAAGFHTVNLNIRYLMGARMDRRISPLQPFTMEIIARLIRQAGFARINVLDPHSEVCLSLLGAKRIMPDTLIKQVLSQYAPEESTVIIPDAGARDRVLNHMEVYDFPHVQGRKHRDPQTGKLSSFSIDDPSLVEGMRCLILDDLCDGGGTFTGLSHVLREAGAKSVSLYVTHFIGSKGFPLSGIDHIWTTDSYGKWMINQPGFTILPIGRM